jgi:hypothetical protein
MSELTDHMRTAAATIEIVVRLYSLGTSDHVALSADWLRKEADVLDRPIAGAE